jgi:hypothetical protein
MCSGTGIGHWFISPRSRTAIRPLPINPPLPAHRHPEEAFLQCSPRMMVKRSRSLVEPTRMP